MKESLRSSFKDNYSKTYIKDIHNRSLEGSKITKHKFNNQFKVKLPNLETRLKLKAKKNNILNIFHQKGKSIFENDFIDNALGTINSVEFNTLTKQQKGKIRKEFLNSNFNLNESSIILKEKSIKKDFDIVNIITTYENNNKVFLKDNNSIIFKSKNIRKKFNSLHVPYSKNFSSTNEFETKNTLDNKNKMMNVKSYSRLIKSNRNSNSPYFRKFLENTISKNNIENNFVKNKTKFLKYLNADLNDEIFIKNDIRYSESSNKNEDSSENKFHEINNILNLSKHKNKNSGLINYDSNIEIKRKNADINLINDYYLTTNDVEINSNFNKITNNKNKESFEKLFDKEFKYRTLQNSQFDIYTKTIYNAQSPVVTVEDFGTQFNCEEDLKLYETLNNSANSIDFIKADNLKNIKNLESKNLLASHNFFENDNSLIIDNASIPRDYNKKNKIEKFSNFIINKNLNFKNAIPNKTSLFFGYEKFDRYEKIKDKYFLSPIHRKLNNYKLLNNNSKIMKNNSNKFFYENNIENNINSNINSPIKNLVKKIRSQQEKQKPLNKIEE